MLQSAIEAEVDGFVVQHADRRDENGKRLIVRNGSLPSRELPHGSWSFGSEAAAGPGTISPLFGPGSASRRACCRRTCVAASRSTKLIPWLYLKGISTGDFSEALSALVGPQARALSANVIVRLKAEVVARIRAVEPSVISPRALRLLLGRRHPRQCPARRRGRNHRQCLLVLMGATLGREEGTDRRRRWLSGKRTKLDRNCCMLTSEAGNGLAQAPTVGHRRWSVGILGRVRKVLAKPAFFERSLCGSTRRPTCSTKKNMPKACPNQSERPTSTKILAGR